MVASLAQDIFKELAQIEGCQGPMQMRLIPTLVSIMQAPPDKIPSGLCAVSLQGHKKTQVYTRSQLSEVGINVSLFHKLCTQTMMSSVILFFFGPERDVSVITSNRKFCSVE